MRWVRSNSRFGAGAALFALALQLVLSFDHIHPEDIQGPSAVVAAQTRAQPDAPAGDDDHRGTPRHHFCAICTALKLTSSSVLPIVELPAIPVAHPHEWVVDVQSAHISSNFHFLFQARAPPLSS